MGHYYSEMRAIEAHERLDDFLQAQKGKSFVLTSESGETLKLTRDDLRQVLRERSNALGDLAQVRALFRKLSR